MTDSLKTNGIGVTFEHGPGEHNWVFWDQWIQRALEWLFEENQIKNPWLLLAYKKI